MSLMSNAVFFPLFQIALVGFAAWCFWRDHQPRPETGIGVEVIRGAESMKNLKWVVGIAVYAIVSIMNKAAFDDDGSGFRQYSVFVNFVDLTAIVYLFYFSAMGRNQVIGLLNALQVEK